MEEEEGRRSGPGALAVFLWHLVLQSDCPSGQIPVQKRWVPTQRSWCQASLNSGYSLVNALRL